MRNVFFIFCLISVLNCKAQSVFVLSDKNLDEIRKTDAYKNRKETDHNTWFKLTNNLLSTKTEVSISSKNHVIEIFLELDQTINLDLTKFFDGRIDKFKKKYPSNYFGLTIQFNGNVYDIGTSSFQWFTDYPHLTSIGAFEPYNYLYAKGPAGGFLIGGYRLVVEDMIDQFKDKLKDGENEIKIIITANQKEYASTTVIHNLSKFDPTDDYCALDEPVDIENEFEQTCKNLYKKTFAKHDLLAIGFSYSEMQTRYNDEGIPTVRYNTASVLVKREDGKHYRRICHFKEMYQGKGTWSKLVAEYDGQKGERLLDIKCIEAYKTKFNK